MKENHNIHTNDKLICTQGNAYYSEGEVYTVGRIVNDKYFQLLTSGNDDHWYATLDDQGIYVSFDTATATNNKAFLIRLPNCQSGHSLEYLF
ncbi:hypothetical protein ACOBWA_05190 [Psychrobacter sp. ER1]|uniref:hypothetical protein n=1 Tax=Psychrobacter sp. ER1 TaxID=3406645 RepID=UPI003B433D91